MQRRRDSSDMREGASVYCGDAGVSPAEDLRRVALANNILSSQRSVQLWPQRDNCKLQTAHCKLFQGIPKSGIRVRVFRTFVCFVYFVVKLPPLHTSSP